MFSLEEDTLESYDPKGTFFSIALKFGQYLV